MTTDEVGGVATGGFRLGFHSRRGIAREEPFPYTLTFYYLLVEGGLWRDVLDDVDRVGSWIVRVATHYLVDKRVTV